MGELRDRNVDEVTGGNDAIIDVVPQLEPEHGSGERIIDLVEVQLELLQRDWIESYLGVGQISVVDLVGTDGLSDVHFDFI